MTDTSALVAFIRARLDEDEAAAGAIDVPDWRAESSWMRELIEPLPSQKRLYDGQFPLITEEDVAHIALHDPARVLREVEAKRKIVEMLVTWDSAEFPNFDGGYASAAEDAVRWLAQPYSDHPDWREEWRP